MHYFLMQLGSFDGVDYEITFSELPRAQAISNFVLPQRNLTALKNLVLKLTNVEPFL